MLDELRAFDPGLDIVVVSDGSTDRTAAVAAARGRARDPAAVQPRHRRRRADGLPLRLEEGYDLAVRVDGDGQHDAPQLAAAARARARGEADIAVGSRFADGDRRLPPAAARRVGIRMLARVVSLIARQRVTDPTSGFQALNRRAIGLFAADYPHDYPEVEGP